MDREKIKESIRSLLRALGEDPDREGLKKTPERMADMFEELLSAKNARVDDISPISYGIMNEDMVILRDIPFYSICEHHMLPFFGKCFIGYIPKDKKIVGISKLAAIPQSISRKLQIQERLTSEIADIAMEKLKPRGVGVVLNGRHMCMEMTGQKNQGEITTSAMRGAFKSDPGVKTEFLKLIM